MRVVAYCARRYTKATEKICGREAVLYTCPPLTDGAFRLGREHEAALYGYDVLVLNLHGFPNLPVWLGDDGQVALKAETLAGMDLNKVGVCAVNCYLGDEPSVMRNAVWQSGAAWLLAGAGENYGGTVGMVGADVLIHHFLKALPGRTPEGALVRAKRMARVFAPQFSADHRRALKDALEFTITRRD